MPEETGRAHGSSPPNEAEPDGTPSSNDVKRNRRNRGRRTGVQQTRFTGVCEELKEHVYDTGVGRNNAEIFNKTTKAVAEYVATTPPPPPPPPPPEATATVVELKIWEMDFKEYRKRLEERERGTWKNRMPSS